MHLARAGTGWGCSGNLQSVQPVAAEASHWLRTAPYTLCRAQTIRAQRPSRGSRAVPDKHSNSSSSGNSGNITKTCSSSVGAARPVRRVTPQATAVATPSLSADTRPSTVIEEPPYLKDFNLNAEQQRAALSTTPHTRVIAGPGSGKTTTLAARIVHLLATGKQPEQILLVTFTIAAADELKSRIGTAVGWEVAERMTIGTLHSVCVQQVLRPHGTHDGLGKFWTASQTTQEQVIKQILQRSNLHSSSLPHGQPTPSAAALLQKVSKLKNFVESIHRLTGVELVNIVRGTDGSGWQGSTEQGDRLLADVYDAYQREMAARNLLDFDDQLHRTLQLMRNNPKVQTAICQRWTDVLVDESQDLNRCQCAILECFAINADSYMVGDSYQSIYAWRGAVNSLWLQPFNGHKVEKLALACNYRSVKPIVDVCNMTKDLKCEAFPDVEPSPPGASVLGPGHDIAARIITVTTRAEEVRNVVEFIQDSHRSGMAWSDMVVLCRSLRTGQAEALREALIEKGIPVTDKGFNSEDDLLISSKATAAIALLELVLHPGSADLALQRSVDLPLRQNGSSQPSNFGERLLADIMAPHANQELAESAAGYLHTLAKTKSMTDVPAAMNSAFNVFQHQAAPVWSDPQAAIDFSTAELEALKRIRALVAVIRAAAEKVSAPQAVQLLLQLSGLTVTADTNNAQTGGADWMDRLIAIGQGFGRSVEPAAALGQHGGQSNLAVDTSPTMAAAATGSPVSDGRDGLLGITGLRQFYENLANPTHDQGGNAEDAVLITTIHQSKGRQWPCGVLIDTQKICYSSRHDNAGNKENFDLMYVGMSRMMFSLLITRHLERDGSKHSNTDGSPDRTAVAALIVYCADRIDQNGSSFSPTPGSNGSQDTDGFVLQIVSLLTGKLEKSPINGVAVFGKRRVRYLTSFKQGGVRYG